MDYEVDLVSVEFKDIYGDEIEEYLRHYPFPIQEFFEDEDSHK